MITDRATARPPVSGSTLLGLGVAGAVVTAVALITSAAPVANVIGMPPAARVVVVASAAALALTAALAPQSWRREVLAVGLAALGAEAALAAVSDPLAVAALLVMVGLIVAARSGAGALAPRARGAAFAGLLLGLGWTFVHMPGPVWLGRVGALALALTLPAAAGLVPYLTAVEVDVAWPAGPSFLPWTGFLAPALALSLPGRLLSGLNPDQGAVFGATLVALGLVNLGWGTIGAWRTASDLDAWRCSFLADWGLALVGIGLFAHDGFAAAYLCLLAIVLVRLPLARWAFASAGGAGPAAGRPAQVLLAVLLAGAAPFSGFPVRLFLLHAATAVSWPLAAALAVGMLVWLAHAARLARTLPVPSGRRAAVPWLVVGVSLILGLAPGVLRTLGGA